MAPRQEEKARAIRREDKASTGAREEAARAGRGRGLRGGLREGCGQVLRCLGCHAIVTPELCSPGGDSRELKLLQSPRAQGGVIQSRWESAPSISPLLWVGARNLECLGHGELEVIRPTHARTCVLPAWADPPPQPGVLNAPHRQLPGTPKGSHWAPAAWWSWGHGVY